MQWKLPRSNRSQTSIHTYRSHATYGMARFFRLIYLHGNPGHQPRSPIPGGCYFLRAASHAKATPTAPMSEATRRIFVSFREICGPVVVSVELPPAPDPQAAAKSTRDICSRIVRVHVLPAESGEHVFSTFLILKPWSYIRSRAIRGGVGWHP